MAQKRNPVSLRLQTRLQGHEKRFVSCWFTDLFFSQVYTNDLMRRLYLGHLLQKGGSWYGETSESRIPETCISIQFLYRKCSILSIVLDKRKEEYLLSNSDSTKQSFGRLRREDTTLLSQIQTIPQHIQGVARQSLAKEQIHSSLNGKNGLPSLKTNTQEKAFLHNRDNLLHLCGGIYASLFSPHCRGTPNVVWRDLLADKIIYQSIANSFGSIVATHTHSYLGATNLLNKGQDLLRKRTSCHYHIVPGSPYLSTIESICNLPRASKQKANSSTHGIGLYENYLQQPFSAGGSNHPSDHSFSAITATATMDLRKETSKDSFTSNLPLKLSSHWTSFSLIRGVSTCQNVEFCLYSVLFLCKKRFSFLKIKQLIFKMLASNPTVRGARLVYSGRQGGRSKSAMRAKKQSALWGETALSLFSSRLAFASTGVDTSFGQIGIKLWICYK